MRLAALLFFLSAGVVHSVDYSDYPAVCKAIAEADEDISDTEDLRICVCSLETIAAELGEDVAKITVQWQYEDKTLPEITDKFSVDEFYAMMEQVGPKLDAACAG